MATLARVEPERPRSEAGVGTILYATDRKLALIDGRIVQPGGEIRGGRVIDIAPTTVLLPDSAGRSSTVDAERISPLIEMWYGEREEPQAAVG